MSTGIKELFNSFNIGTIDDEEEILLTFESDFYINHIDDESIFFEGIYEEKISYGQPLQEFFNLTFTLAKHYPIKIIEYFEKYKEKYNVPNLEFLKELYNDFRNLNISNLVVRTIIFDILSLCEANNELSNIDYRGYFDYLVTCINPLSLKFENDFESIPSTINFNATFRIKEQQPIIVYTNIDSASLQCIDMYHVNKHNIKFHRCSYCKNFYIQNHGNNLKYCIHCKKTPIELTKNDDYYKLYRKKYKTMKQRENRSEYPWKYSDNYTSPWIKEVNKKMIDYKKNSDYIGFQKYIDKSMQVYKPKKGSD